MGDAAPLVVCGPSGVGKSVLIKKLQALFPGKFGFSVSHTTRGPREGEENGVHYHFSDRETMQGEIDAGLFIEHADVHGNLYGTSKAAVETVVKEGKVCILDIDVQGAKSLFEQAAFAGTRFIFVHPPSLEELERRLRGRGTETEEKVQKRLANAVGEIEFSNSADFFDQQFILDGLQGDNMPQEVLELLGMLQGWYPSLGEMPEQFVVLGQFRRADKAGHGVIPRKELENIFQKLGSEKDLGPGFTEEELSSLMEIASVEDGRGVDYQRFINVLFSENPES